MSDTNQTSIESILTEDRIFNPSPEFSANADIKSFAEYEAIYEEAEKDPVAFWESVAENIHWFKKWDTPLEWNEPHAKWFVGGKTNVSYNCLDRHLETWRKNKAAIIWEGEPEEETRTITYQQLHGEVCKFANSLKALGIEKGDRVAIYMPMVPEATVAMLACARIGATHTVIFGGFSADSIRDRVNDCGCKAVITADGGYRRGSVLKLKETVDEAVENCPSIESVVVLERTKNEVEMKEGRDHWWHDLVDAASEDCPAEPIRRLCPSRSTRSETRPLYHIKNNATPISNHADWSIRFSTRSRASRRTVTHSGETRSLRSACSRILAGRGRAART